MGFLGDRGGVVVADVRVERGDQHQRRAHQLVDATVVGLDSDDAVVGEGDRGVAEQLDALQVVEGHDGLEHVELEVAVGAADGDRDRVAHDLGADHGEGLGLGRVDLAGHD